MDERRPAGIGVERGAASLQITLRWSAIAAAIYAIWGGVWAGMLSFFLTLGGRPLSLAHPALAVPALIAWYVAAMCFFNRTTVVVDRSDLTVRHGPLPWRLRKVLALGEIHEFGAQEKVSYTKGGRVRRHRVVFAREDGKVRTLLAIIALKEDQAWFIAEALNERLRELRGLPRGR